MTRPILLPFPGVSPTQTGEIAGADRPFFSRIDSLRGLGAAAVAAYHLSGCTFHGISFLPLEAGAWNDVGRFEFGLGKFIVNAIPAHAALMFFLVVSGFVLRLSLEFGPSTTGPALGRFVVTRAFRFFPIVFVATIILAILSRFHLAPYPIDESFAFKDFFAHALLLDISGVGVLWALQVELLMVPILFMLWKVERIQGGLWIVLAFGVIASALSFKPSWALSRPLSQNLFAFVLGTTIPALVRPFVQRLTRRNARIWCAIGIAALFTTLPAFGTFNRFGCLIEGYAAWVIVSFVAYRKDISLFHILDLPWLVRFGKWSGSYYVLHILTVPIWLRLLESIVPTSWSTSSPLAVGFASLTIWLLLMVGVAALGYRFVEEPGIRCGARLVRTWGWSRKKVTPRIEEIPLRRAA